MPTASTLPLLILITVLWRLTGGQVLPIVLFTSVFSAASVLNLGVIGISPWLFSFVLCVALRLVLKGHGRLTLAPGYNKPAVRLFLLFVLWTVLSAACFPLLFQGVFVDHGTTSGPLTWHMSNLAQTLYLLAVSAVYLLTIGASPEERANAQEWFIRGCIVASLFAFYQLANAVVHIPYPSAALYTNPSYVIYPAYRINGFWRLNSTFCEASEMASFLLPGAALLGWELMTARRVRPGRVAAFLLILCALLFTMSSLGYLGLITMFTLGPLLYAGRILRQRTISHGRVIALVLLVGGLGTFVTLSENGVATVTKVLTATILDKSKSDSYRERTATHVAALRTLRDTAYMGAGWGSIRASGLGYVLLGTVGVPGTFLFVAFYLASYLPFFYRQRPRPGDGPDRFVPGLLAVNVTFLAMVTAGSEPVTPVFWVLLGVVATARPLRRAPFAPGLQGRPALKAFAVPSAAAAGASLLERPLARS